MNSKELRKHLELQDAEALYDRMKQDIETKYSTPVDTLAQRVSDLEREVALIHFKLGI